ncbi:MAG: hypothetical protein ABR610_17735 [Thermoanaerobaculia bacterium]
MKVKRTAFLIVSLLVGLAPASGVGEAISVRHAEGLVHGFLVLRSVDGSLLAHGDLIQTSRGSRVSSRLVFHFKDGSVQDETAVFSQSGRFRLLTDHLIQRGPSFPHPLEVSIDAVAGRVTVKHREQDGAEKVIDEKMALPEDLANGLVLTLVKNIAPDAAATVSMVVATPKPRLVKLVLARAGNDRFAVGGGPYKVTRFTAHVDIGGFTGLLARLLGRQPPDASVWILEGEAPGFVRSENVFFQDGPVWRIELASPVPSRKP